MVTMNVSKHPILVALFFFVLFSFFKLKPCDGNNSKIENCPEIEKQSLLSFKHSLHDPKNSLSSWNHDEVDCCTWEGIQCSNLTGHVQQLNLQWSGLSGKLSPTLFNLKHLKYLDLSSNYLQGTIHNSIANLTSLITLDLSGNQLSGKIPRGITNLCKLQNLNLSYNQLCGPLTHQFGEFKSLEILNLIRNSLSGVLPRNLGNLSSLKELDLEDNKFTGNLPESIGQLSNLQILRIKNNMMEGIVTETHFSHLSRLEYLFASGNNLTLRVSPNWIPPFKLLSLSMGSWNLMSSIPPWLDTQKMSIEELDLSNTGIYGKVPNWLWSMTFINLSHNQLNGKIPLISDPIRATNFLGLHPYYITFNGIKFRGAPLVGKLQYVHLGSNKFSGQLPRVGRYLVNLDLSNNSFSGDLSDFLCNTMTSSNRNIEYLHLGGNQLTGELPNCFMKWSSLFALNLGSNNLSGRIPNSIGYLASLRSLNLNGNNFWGHIPLSMHKCTQLRKMDLSHNNLSGNLSKLILTSLTDLVILILKSNKLSGQITPSICQLTSLQIIDLSDNMFSGMIPTCVDNFTAMATKKSGDGSLSGIDMFGGTIVESASIYIKGMELTYERILLLVTGIDFSKNNLSGHIPKEITSLVELRTLNLSRNHLTGPIPRSIGNMKQLESLDFSINSLSGELPNSFTAMSTLDYLNVSHNNLTGRIPESTQLRGFNESSFIGNNLCGPPLISPCSINDGKAPAGTAHSKHEKGDKTEIEWLYVFISLGYAVGLSGVLTTLYLKRSWREAYYDFFEKIWDDVYVYVLIKWRRVARARARARASGPNM